MKLCFKIAISFVIAVLILIVFDWFLVAMFHYNTYSAYENVLELTDRTEQNLPFNKQKQPVVTVGCSFIYGFNIRDWETFAYKLQKLTKRKTYNLGINTTGIQHVLYRLQNQEFFQNPNLNPQYVIYVFISDHIRRMYSDYFAFYSNEKYLKYEKKGNDFKPRSADISFLDRLKVTYTGKKANELSFKLKNDNEKFDLFKLYVKECKKALNEKYPNSKFVVIVYNSQLDLHDFKPFKTNRWKELEDEGVIVINFDTKEYDFLNDEEYKASDRNHPSGKAWDVLVPVIAKKLNL